MKEPFETIFKIPENPLRIKYNTTHAIKGRESGDGLAVTLNWRNWGASVSWGDVVLGKFEKGIALAADAWFAGVHLGPIIASFAWLKKANENITRCNHVHLLLRKPTSRPGFEINCNLRYWGVAVSWGDSLELSTRKPVWFVRMQAGPFFISFNWNKTTPDPWRSFRDAFNQAHPST